MTRKPLIGARRARARAVALVLPVVAALTLSSCSISLFPFLSESPGQLATTAAGNWSKAAAHHVRGAFQIAQLGVSTDVQVASRGADATGSGNGNGKPYQFLEVRGKTYLKGQSFWQAYFAGNPDDQLQAKGFQENWTVAGGNQVAQALAGLSDLDHLVPLLRNEAKHLKQAGQGTVDGRQATELTDGQGHTWWTTSGGDGQVVKVVAGSAGSLKLVSLTVGTAPAPGNLAGQLGKPVVDPSNPATLPARYDAVAQHEAGNCDQDGCAIDVTVENQGGTPAGPAVVTVTAFEDSNMTQMITSCMADVPPSIATNQSGTATCTLQGSAWVAFVNQNPNGGTFYVQQKVTTNPPYV